MRHRSTRVAAFPAAVTAALALGASPAPAAAAAPDLVMTAASKPPRTVAAGARLRMRVTVANRARGRAGGSRVGLYLSANARWSSADTALDGSGRTRGLGADRRAALRVRAQVPRRTPPGRRLRLLACADARGEVAESNERNNCRVAGELVVVGGSSFEVIDAQVRRGRLNSSRALLYKLFAVFGDGRLPERYRGDGSRVSGTSAVSAALDRLPSLPRAIRARVEPFLMPPAYRGSFGARVARTAQGEGFDACAVRSPGWDSVETANGGARVWWRTASDDKADAQRLQRELGGMIWSSLTTVMTGHEPLSDAAGRCGGPDGKLDVYLWPMGDPKVAATRPFAGTCRQATSSYVLVDPKAPRAVLAHEFMHVLQFTYPRVGDCRRWDYLDDATATWAENHAFATDQTEHQYSQHVADPAVLFGYGNGYPGWAFMLSATRHAGGSAPVRRIYELAAGRADPLDALDGALPGGLQGAWPAFAKDAWNRPLLPGALTESFFSWDSWRLRPGVQPVAYRLGTRRWEGPLPIELFGLTRQYYDLDFSDRGARRITFSDPSAAGVDPQLRTWAFLKIARQGWRAEDWTGRDEVDFCRDTAAEDVRQVVVVHSTARRPPASDPARAVTQSQSPKLKLQDRCEAGAVLTLSGQAVYTAETPDCGLEYRSVIPSWRLQVTFDLPGRIERGVPDPVDAGSGAGSGSIALDEDREPEETDCPVLEHLAYPLEWQNDGDGESGLTLRLLRKGDGLEVEIRMGHFGFLAVGDPRGGGYDVTPFGLGAGPDPFEDGACKEIHGTIAASEVGDRRISLPVSGACDVRFGPDGGSHSVSQAGGTLVITQ
jgi:hypothetical protein